MIICVTGQVGSGKTAVCRILREIDKNINLIDADKIGHKLLNKKIVKEKLIKEFGKNIINNKKEINRKILAKIVFNDTKKLQKLNKIIHPLLIKEIKEKINNQKINVIDAALFSNLKLKNICDKIIIVKTSKKNILMRNKNKAIKNILKMQKIIKEEGITVNNDKDKKELKNKITKIYNQLTK